MWRDEAAHTAHISVLLQLFTVLLYTWYKSSLSGLAKPSFGSLALEPGTSSHHHWTYRAQLTGLLPNTSSYRTTPLNIESQLSFHCLVTSYKEQEFQEAYIFLPCDLDVYL